jgi:ABC-type polysaccharide/polyol phosphate transport system ATPase subunit
VEPQLPSNSASATIASDPTPQRSVSILGETQAIVQVRELNKKFRIYPTRWGRLAEWLTFNRSVRHQDFFALRDVSFEVGRGESLGIIGVNGSGKSTLLKILSGAMYPTSGNVTVSGRVLSLLELGTGLNNELTGRQNVVNSARLLGFPAEYAIEKMSRIESFAELGDFFDRPARLYSSGMLVRLSFSMFACFDPEIFIVDEALSVGDVFFQQKCARRIQEMRAGGTTMLFVSHDLAAVEALCDRVLLLHAGRVRHDGDKKAGISLYYAVAGAGLGDVIRRATSSTPSNRQTTAPDESGRAADPEGPQFGPIDPNELPWQPPGTRDSFGDGRVEIDGICFRREKGAFDPVVTHGQWLEAMVRCRAVRDTGPCNIGITIYDRMNRVVFARGWLNADLPPLELRPNDVVVARFLLKLDLEPGEYTACFTASEALADPGSPTGWDTRVGGTRFIELPRAAVVAVVPNPQRPRDSFGPANLRTRLDRMLIRDGDAR